jgi:hypothetical protein
MRARSLDTLLLFFFHSRARRDGDETVTEAADLAAASIVPRATATDRSVRDSLITVGHARFGCSSVVTVDLVRPLPTFPLADGCELAMLGMQSRSRAL